MNHQLTNPSTQQTSTAITYIKQGIAHLSQDVRKDITQHQIEYLHDSVIDSLNAVLCRLGVDGCAQ